MVSSAAAASRVFMLVSMGVLLVTAVTVDQAVAGT
jgi:hypothetical protein